jgi:5'-3' exonuclease
MGIERFFSSIEENKIATLKGAFTKTLSNKLLAECFLIDFNSIVYNIKHKFISDLNKVLFNLIRDNTFDDTLLKPYELSKFNITFNDNITPKEYHDIFDNDMMNNIIVELVSLYIINMLENYIQKDRLEILYIAIDGVPFKTKMLEQKKRRYMGEVATLMKEKIYNKYKEQIKQNKNRYTYEKYKIDWKSHNITPGTDFMHKIFTILSSIDFEVTLKDTCKNLKQYLFSSSYESGEGENKIVNYLRDNDLKYNNYLIYSPDSDVTLLGLLLNTKLNNKRISKLSILRHNQQKGKYDVVDIDNLSSNIFEYVKTKLFDDYKLDNPIKDNIINDIVFILTIFGNDFLPKIEAFNVKYDFDRIINKYIDVLGNSKGKYLIYYSNKEKKRKINEDVFLNVIDILHKKEGKNLQKVYASTHYRNYNRIKKLLNVDQNNFTEKLNTFLDTLQDLNNDISNKEFKIEKWLDQTKFINILKRLTRFDDKYYPNYDNELFLQTYYEYYDRNKRLPKILITFHRFNRSLEERYHNDNFKKGLTKLEDLSVPKYDKELFQFENMLDQYVDKLNAYKLDLGYISVDHKTYHFKSEDILKGVKRYYKDFFDIDDIDINNDKMKQLVQHYIDGLLWVFEYYFNNYNEDYHRKNANIWFYPYTHAPLLTQIYQLIKTKEKNYIDKTINRLTKFIIPRTSFFNCLEQLMYVNPNTVLKLLAPKEYHKVLTTEYYPDLNKLVDDLWNNKSKLVDCRGVIFLMIFFRS